jgi:peptidoglycan/LPS O-acetylase OafA/YrhL
LKSILILRGRAKAKSDPLPARERKGYLPTLDGWRALAILSVIFYHDAPHSIGPIGTGWLAKHGFLGVDLFFGISGLLICWRLLDEERLFGRISLPGFYIRRAFRILPPAFACLGAIGILGIKGTITVGLGEWLGSVFFFRNYTSLLGLHGSEPFFTMHFWSLALEEHFYLILPSLLVFTRNRWRIPVLLGLTLLIELNRMQVLEHREWEQVLHHTDTRLDALLIPAVFAVLVQSENLREKMARWLRIWPLLLIAVLILTSFWYGRFWDTVVIASLVPMTILGSVLNPQGYLALALEWSPLRYLGRISYSLYLWQQLFFTALYRGGFPLGILERTPLRFIALLVVAMASYHLLERPFVKLGHRLAPPATPSRVRTTPEV